ncbi:MAG: hypothetical protein U5K43_09220 [Halofilum sp. (in: g-proteobacteria)]|nr:hypothetical protein [Halofilum sp. (in: g-proteobacteria)]
MSLPGTAGAADGDGSFAGFRAIVLACVHPPGVALLEAACEQARARIGLAAARADVRLVLAPANDAAARRRAAAAADAVVMRCTLAIDDRDGARARRAIHARLSLVRAYRAAVEAGAESGPGAVPRAGVLELWAQDIIASGPADELAPALAGALARLAGNGLQAYRAGGGAAAGD